MAVENQVDLTSVQFNRTSVDRKMKQQRRLATCYYKTVLSFESFLNFAAARLWLESFVYAA
ncbi:MAG: hypothetical protein MEQ84_13915 [Mesorhizobium sp.]|nr:hypothetical protein [Mesorhizobium sp.]